jgi:hypothetical protein
MSTLTIAVPQSVDAQDEFIEVPKSSPDDSGILLQRLKAQTPQAVLVAGLSREIHVKIASERREWEEAFRLVAESYRARGYEPPDSSAIRFTRHHALPETVVFVAKHKGHVVCTFSMVPDNRMLGLPMDSIYESEIQELRGQGRRLAELTSLADKGLSPREFLYVFIALLRLAHQYHVDQGGDTWVITVNPRHRSFYTKKMGYVPLGVCRAYPTVQNAPAEAFFLDQKLMKANAPKMYEELFGKPLPASALVAPQMPRHLATYFGSHCSQTEVQTVREVFDYQDLCGSMRTW